MTISAILILKFDRETKLEQVNPFFFFILFLAPQEFVDISNSILLFLDIP